MRCPEDGARGEDKLPFLDSRAEGTTISEFIMISGETVSKSLGWKNDAAKGSESVASV